MNHGEYKTNVRSPVVTLARDRMRIPFLRKSLAVLIDGVKEKVVENPQMSGIFAVQSM